MKTLIVGQAPSKDQGDVEPLSGRSGKRLAELCGIDHAEFLERFERVNVLGAWPGKAGKGDRFPLMLATTAARDRIVPMLPGRRIVLLGKAGLAVERALMLIGHNDARDLSWATLIWHHVRFANGLAAISCCPHPSGVNRWWNEAANEADARAFWRGLAVQVSEG